jgi:hypothetical protein
MGNSNKKIGGNIIQNITVYDVPQINSYMMIVNIKTLKI